jgi:hypothetical protein
MLKGCPPVVVTASIAPKRTPGLSEDSPGAIDATEVCADRSAQIKETLKYPGREGRRTPSEAVKIPVFDGRIRGFP